MKNILKQSWVYIFILVCGLFFKVYKLDNKFFWFDEVYTVIQTSGFQINEPPVDEIWSIEQYRQNIRPGRDDISISSALRGQLRNTNLNPLHYVCLTFWIKITGSGLMSYRWFNFFILILTLPVLFLLARKLFHSDVSGWIAVAIYTCAPFINFYSQEARYSILWAFLVILTSYLLLKALEKQKFLWWMYYVIAGVLSLYASTMCFVVIMAHVVYVFIFHRRFFVRVLISAVCIFLGYAPWLYSLFTIREEVNTALAWHSTFGSQPIWKLLVGQIYIPSNNLLTFHGFVGEMLDFIRDRFGNSKKDIITKIQNIVLPLFVILCVVGTRPKHAGKSFWFIILIVIFQILFFVISDGIRDVSGSFLFRYQMIYMICIYLFLTGAFAHYTIRKKWWAQSLFIIFSGLSLWSCNKSVQNSCFNQHPICYKYTYSDAVLYDNSGKTLIVTDYSGNLFNGYPAITAIMELCDSDSIDILRAGEHVNDVILEAENKGYNAIYIAYASDDLMDGIKVRYNNRLAKASQNPDWWTGVWQIENSENELAQSVN